jgi:hypothetical protein
LREALTALGPYFAVDRHDPASPPRDGWQPLAALTSSSEALRARAVQVGAALASGAEGEVEPRVAASVAQLGLVARLVAPVFGAAVLAARLLLLDEARWHPVLGGPMPLSLPERALSGVAWDGPLSGALAASVIAGPVRTLVEHAQALSLSPKVAWGNVASAINATAAMAAKVRPDLAGQSRELAQQLLAGPALQGCSEGEPGTNFRRRSCCLIYRVAPRGPRVVCGDCVLESSR